MGGRRVGGALRCRRCAAAWRLAAERPSQEVAIPGRRWRPAPARCPRARGSAPAPRRRRPRDSRSRARRVEHQGRAARRACPRAARGPARASRRRARPAASRAPLGHTVPLEDARQLVRAADRDAPAGSASGPSGAAATTVPRRAAGPTRPAAPRASSAARSAPCSLSASAPSTMATLRARHERAQDEPASQLADLLGADVAPVVVADDDAHVGMRPAGDAHALRARRRRRRRGPASRTAAPTRTRRPACACRRRRVPRRDRPAPDGPRVPRAPAGRSPRHDRRRR